MFRPPVTLSSPMLIALWLVVAQLFGASSLNHATTGGGSARASVVVAVAAEQSGGGDTATDRDASLRDAGSRRAVAWLRAVQPLARVAAPRSESPRSIPPTTTAAASTSVEAALVATVRVRMLDVSHAVAARGALLSYYATAPPLQG